MFPLVGQPHLSNEDIFAFGICTLLTMVAALVTVAVSVLAGSALAYEARPTFRYGFALAALFIPFAVGGSVWAYSVTQIASLSGIQGGLLSSGTLGRALALLSLSLARTLPLGTFFCATSLQRYTTEIRPYFQVHRLRLPFFLLCAINRIPKSILMLLGLFGGSLMASEASLPTFLYRANPGTGPETTNLILARVFREIYASVGPESLPHVAALGIVLSLLLLGCSLVGTWLGRGVLHLFCRTLQRCNLLSNSATLLSFIPQLALLAVFAPGIMVISGLLIPGHIGATQAGFIERLFAYRDIVAVGIMASATITITSISVAVALRYGKRDLLRALENRTAAACVLLLPAFVPVLSIVAVLSTFSSGQVAGVSGYLSLFFSHVCLHYPVFQFICFSLIASIPERHVSWQRTMSLEYAFSVVTDGFRRHMAVVVSLAGLGTVQVVTDDTVSRWFSHLVKAPEEALYGALFGRLSSAEEASLITWSVAVVALVVCGVLASSYVRDLRSQPRYA